MRKIGLILSLLIISAQLFAVDTHQLSDPEQQKSYELIISELRCLVCQNQTIADSNAELADDLRRQVAEMLQQGKTKAEIINFMTDRYGDFVLYNPPFKPLTSLLWLGPLIFLIVGFVTVFWIIKRKNQSVILPIAEEKKEKIRRLLDSEDLP